MNVYDVNKLPNRCSGMYISNGEEKNNNNQTSKNFDTLSGMFVLLV